MSRLDRFLARQSTVANAKKGTDREAAVLAIWNLVTKPSRTYATEAERLAYLAGVADEKKAQTEYDRLLREAGLR